MRAIDADALMKCIRANHYRLTIPYLNSTDNGMFTDGIQQVVDEQPTISVGVCEAVKQAYEKGKRDGMYECLKELEDDELYDEL